MSMRRLSIRLAFASALLSLSFLHAQTTSLVPFVGCASDGQVGPLKAPHDSPKRFPINRDAASRLSYYRAEESGGVLAPRGWFCFGTYGSNGSVLYISPKPIDSGQIFSDKWSGLPDSAIQLVFRVGDTSGRFEVAQMIARVFPTYIARTREVIAEGIEPASDFPAGPYSADKLTYKSRSMVEFETPPASEGLGSHSFLKENSEPIFGVAALVFEYPNHQWPSLMHLSMRLPPDSRDLEQVILKQAEREVTQVKPQ